MFDLLYDPFLRKEVFEDKPWYNDFWIFHDIGVCKVEDKHVAEIREALARFLFATETRPGDKPGYTFITGNGAIEMNDMDEYIKNIRGKGKDKRQSVCKIIAEGEHITDEKVKQALSAIGLTITSIQTGYNLDKTIEPLPKVIPGIASACRSTLEDGEFPDGWDDYHYLDKVIAVCDTDDVEVLAERICKVIVNHEDNFTAGNMTAELILFCGGGLI